MRILVATLIGATVMVNAAGAQALDPTKVETGQKAYVTAKCATCHAIKGSGGKIASALGGVGAKLSEEDIRKWLTTTGAMEEKLATKPKASMAAYLKTHMLADDDIDGLVAFLMSQK
jgi:mono/diheme cytochrome c family protein